MDLLYHNLKIRNAIPDDAAILAAWWNDGALMAHAGFPNGIGTTETEVAKKIASESDETVRRLMIEYENEPIGEKSCKRSKSKCTFYRTCRHSMFHISKLSEPQLTVRAIKRNLNTIFGGTQLIEYFIFQRI